MFFRVFSFLVLIVLCSLQLLSQVGGIISVQPSQNEAGANVNTSIKIKLNISLNADSINKFIFNVFGKISGSHSGKLVYSKENNTLEYFPDEKFAIGEVVSVIVPPLTLTAGSKTSSFQWRFTTGVTKKINAVFNTVNKPDLYYPDLKVFDIDHNGIPDLISSSGNILVNNGRGRFSSTATVTGLAGSKIIPDINGDYHEDLIQYEGDISRILLGSNNGSFTEKEILNDVYVPENGFGDLNGDGYMDLINARYSQLQILWNEGAGHFEKDTVSYNLKDSRGSLNVVDIDNDGDLDIVWLYDRGIYALHNDGKGNFSNCTQFKAGGKWFLEQLYMADFTNDGFVDAAMMGPTNGGIRLLNDRKGGFFTDGSDKDLFWHPELGGIFSVCDLNGDNKQDIIVTDISWPPHSWDTVYAEIAINKDNNLSWPEYKFVIGLRKITVIYGLGFGDFDGDCALDILHAGYPSLISFSDTATTGVSEDVRPDEFYLSQNYPNPFNPSTSIRFSLAKACFVKLSVYNYLGQVINKLVNEEKSAGSYEVQFDGSKLASGIYFCSISARLSDGSIGFSSVKKLILVK